MVVQEIESHVTHAQTMRAEYDALVDDDLVLACVDDFCRLTVRHRVKKAAGGPPGGAYSALRCGSPIAAVAACQVDSVDSYDEKPRATRHHKVRALDLGACAGVSVLRRSCANVRVCVDHGAGAADFRCVPCRAAPRAVP